MKAIVLLSGGLDSATALFWAKSRGFDCHALTFEYGQRHRKELRAAKAVARVARCSLEVIQFKLTWGGSSLLAGSGALPNRTVKKILQDKGIPSTYVPGRNTIFLSFAVSYADARQANAIVIGANAVDFSGYPDCRPAYYKAWQNVLKHGTRLGATGKPLRIYAPLLYKSKKEIVLTGKRLGVPFELTWSCYTGSKTPCGHCDSCQLRAKGFKEAGLPDPAINPKSS